MEQEFNIRKVTLKTFYAILKESSVEKRVELCNEYLDELSSNTPHRVTNEEGKVVFLSDTYGETEDDLKMLCYKLMMPR